MKGRVEVLKKLSLFFILFTLFFIVGCQNSNEYKINTEEPESKSATKVEDDSGNLLHFEGFVVEKVYENGREKVLVVNGIKESEAIKLTFDELAGEVGKENTVYFTNENHLFKEIEEGEKVKVFWDGTVPYSQPSVATYVAVRAEIIK